MVMVKWMLFLETLAKILPASKRKGTGKVICERLRQKWLCRQNSNQHNRGKDMPVFLKRDMEEQIPYLKKQSLRHEQFAVKSVQELFPADAINQSTVDSFNYCASIVAINDGKGNFIISKLPAMAQLSSVNAIQPVDVNGDGHPILLSAVTRMVLPQFERLDASFGDLLLNDGKGNFSWVEQKQSGFMVNGVVRDIALFSNAQKQQLLFLVNNGYPALYSINKNRK